MRMLLNEYLYFKLNELSLSYVYEPWVAFKAQNKQGNSKGGICRVANPKTGIEREAGRAATREGAVIGRASARATA